MLELVVLNDCKAQRKSSAEDETKLIAWEDLYKLVNRSRCVSAWLEDVLKLNKLL